MAARAHLHREPPSRRSDGKPRRVIERAGVASDTHARPVVVELKRQSSTDAPRPRPPAQAASIADYGFLSDCRSSALVSTAGSVDWLCWPRFDSPSLFARILDSEKGGAFAISPTEPYTTERCYVPSTHVIQTTFRTHSGVARINDWLDTGAGQALCRLVECLEGSVELALVCDPRPRYGAVSIPAWRRSLGYLVCGVGDDDRLILDGVYSSHETFTLAAGESRSISLGWNRPGPADLVAALRGCIRYWQHWAADLVLPDALGPEVAAHVERSALTLKGLQYAPSGAFVAAPTTSLPEMIGGDRNWDYRYSWLRDSAFTLYALRAVGKNDEALMWFDWLDAVTLSQGSRDLQIVYAVDGSADVPEIELSHLAGHRDSHPVRVGNGAAKQLQLDVYGTLADAVWLARRTAKRPLPRQRWELIKSVADQVIAGWRRPDEGIWEVRGAARHFVFSKVMCWVALDRAIKLARIDNRHGAPVKTWSDNRDAIRADILAHGYDEQLGSFTQAYGSGTLDAANLLLAQVGFIDPTDPRFVSTVRATQRHLSHDGLVNRYRSQETDDGLEAGEGTFTICAFWLCLALQQIGAGMEARELFTQTLRHANDLNLLSEEVSADGELLGNFPQAFTHIGIIACASALSRAAAQNKPLRLAA
jgi:GH15 family glucan-1,4-alpha-glucosidase